MRQDSKPDDLKKIFDLQKFAVTRVTFAVGGILKLADGGDSVVYSGQDNPIKTTIIGGNGNDTIEDYTGSMVRYINGASGNDFIDSSASVVEGGDGNDTIHGYDDNGMKIYGGNGNDYIHQEKIYYSPTNESTLTGGAGKDIFAFGDDNVLVKRSHTGEYYDYVTITDYTPGQDKLKFERAYSPELDWENIVYIDHIDVEWDDIVIYTKMKNNPSSSGVPFCTGKIKLQNAKGKPITIIDSYGKETTKVYDGTTGTTSEFFSYSQLTTAAQKNEVRENSLENLKAFLSIANDVDAKLSADNFKDKSLLKNTQGWTKFTRLVACLCLQGKISKIDEVENFYTMLDDFNTVLVNIEDIVTGKKPLNDASATASIMDYGANIFDIWQNFSDLFDIKYKVMDFSLIGSILGLCANVVTLADGSKVSDKTRQAFEKSFVDVAGAMVNYAVKSYGLTDKLVGGVKVSSPFGPVNAGIAALTGVVTGVDQFFASNAKYKKDKLATATQNAWIDAFSTGIYEAAHKYTFGADEAIFEGLRWLAYGLTGKADKYKESDLNYMEWIGSAVKFKLSGEVHGNDSGNGISTIAEKTKVVAGAGKDFIIKNYSNVTIYGGAENDTVGGFQLIGTEKNYIDMGEGNDSVTIYDQKSTIYGGKDDDTIKVMGVQANALNVYATDNQIYGDEGNDIIYLNKAVSNTIRGGAGNDTIALENSSKTFIEYKEGDGKDSIIGYGEKDTIRLTRVTSGYNAVANGNDVKIKVGSGEIILVEAKGKKINLSADDTPKKEDMNVLQILQQGTVMNKANLRVSAGYDGNVWAGKDNNLKGVKVIDDTSNSTGRILAGNSKSNSILGGSGKNSLWGGKGGNNTLTGGSSSDQYWFSGGGNDVVTNFKSGNSSDADVLVFYNTGFKKMTRSDKNIIVTGSTGKKITLKSDSGSDTVFLYSKDGKNISGAKVGESSDKSLTYDSAVKYYKLNGNGTLKVTGSDNNKVSLTGGGVTYSGITRIDASGATGDNIFVGSSKLANSIVGGSGKDSLTGDNSTDYLAGGVGDDIISGGKGKDTLYGQAGNDTIRGGTGKDYVSGAAGDDYLYGEDGNDTVRGGSDNDHVYGGNGDDMIYGDKGKDYLSGGAGNDYLSGGADVDTLVGGADNDTLRAGEGNDYLSGGTGDDRLYGEDGEDTLTGGDGNDYISGGTGNDSLVGGTGKDSLHSGTGDDYASGGDGNDKLYGDAGNDILEGEAGKDYLSGGKGDDSLYGGAGNDTVYGGEGNDYLSGGDGKDTFWFNVGGGNDTVTDYVAENDKIQIKSGVLKSGYTDGSDVVFVLSDKKNGKDNGQIIIKDGKDKNISFVGVSGKKYTYINGTRSYTSARIDSSNDVNKSWFMTGDDNYNVYGNYNLEPQTKNSVGNLNISTGQTSNVPEVIFTGSTKNLDGNSQSGLNKV